MIGVSHKTAFQILNETSVRNRAVLECSEPVIEESGIGFGVDLKLLGYRGQDYMAHGTGFSKQGSKHDAAKKILEQIETSSICQDQPQLVIMPPALANVPGSTPNQPLNSETVHQKFEEDTVQFLDEAKKAYVNLKFNYFCDTNGLKPYEHYSFQETSYGKGEDTINVVECNLQGFTTSGAAKKKLDAKKIAILKQLNHWDPQTQGQGFSSPNQSPGREPDVAGPSSTISNRSLDATNYNFDEARNVRSPEDLRRRVSISEGFSPAVFQPDNSGIGIIRINAMQDLDRMRSSGDRERDSQHRNENAFLLNPTRSQTAFISSGMKNLRISDSGDKESDLIIVESKISFHKQQKLGSSSSKVYKGFFEDRPAAVKLIVPDAFHNNEIREIFYLKNIQHTNLVRYYASEKMKNETYVAMQLADFGTLSDFLRDHNPSMDLRIKLLLDVGKGLQHLHNREHIVHRDIKPSNVLIFENLRSRTGLSTNQNPAEVYAKLGDFGISKQLISSNTSSVTRVAGTQKWMSPETIIAYNEEGEISYKVRKSTDIFAYGMLLFYGMSGSHPFAEQENGLMVQVNICRKAEPYWKKFGENVGSYIYIFLCLKNLLAEMLIKDPQEREKKCDINSVVNHPFFWNSSICLEFVRTLASELKSTRFSLYKKIICDDYFTVYGDWGSRMCPDLKMFISDPQKNNSKKYAFDRVDKLNEFIRDKYEHQEVLKNEPFSKSLFGVKFENYMEYFNSAFPELIIFFFEFFKGKKNELGMIKLGEFYRWCDLHFVLFCESCK